MQVDLTIGLLSLIGGFASSFIFYIAVIVKKFATIEADMAGIKTFHAKLMDRMIDLTIDIDTPDLDRLLLAFKRGDILTDQEWKELNNYLEHYHVEATRTAIPNDPAKKIATAFLLAAVEARRERAQRIAAGGPKLWDLFKTLFSWPR